jgi:hypothetical protein
MSSIVDSNDVDTSISQQQAQEQQQQQQIPLMVNDNDDIKNNNVSEGNDTENDDDDDMIANLTLQDITEPIENDSTTTTTTTTSNNNIPKVKFIDNIQEYIQSFLPKIITTELLIGAYTQLHTKYKLTESNLLRKRM